jgi:hypothetical protein
MDNQMLKAALYYRSLGWSVIPLAEGTKIPPKGFSPIPYREKLASEGEIKSWWSGHPDYNIGIVTGKLSNLFVVDIDTDEGKKNIYDLIPEDIATPKTSTPRGGQHLYFKYPINHNLTIGAGNIPGSDFRGEGGYVVAPPSKDSTGKVYSWDVSPNSTKMSNADLPVVYIKALINNNSLYRGVNDSKTGLLKSVNFSLDKGYRDATLFHIANALTKGGASYEDIYNTLKILANSCNPPFPEKEILTKINSAIERAARKERNLSKEILDFVAVSSGYFSVNSCYSVLNIVNSKDKTNIRVGLNKLKSKGIIEKHPNQDGIYRRIETDFDFITFDEDEEPEVEYPVKLPLGLNDLAEVSQGNIILVAGEFNAGKTSFLLNILRANKNNIPIRYITSEMSKSEFKKRFASFGLPLSWWMQDDKTEYLRKSSDFHSAIKPDALNIIDYMEFRDADYTKGAEYLTKIHDALKTGVAVVAVQKKEGLRMPRSGDMILEKPRLAISLSKYNSDSNLDYPQGIAEVLKCKMPKLGKVDGKKLRFELQKNGSKFHVLNEWGYLKF